MNATLHILAIQPFSGVSIILLDQIKSFTLLFVTLLILTELNHSYTVMARTLKYNYL
jgi:hypothetical protein